MLLCFLTMLNEGMNRFSQRFREKHSPLEFSLIPFSIVFNGMLSIKRSIFNDVNFDLKFWVQMEAKLQFTHRISLGDS